MRYRELFERAQGLPTDPELLEIICSELTHWVSTGGTHDDARVFGEIYANWPRPAGPIKLWRVDNLTHDQYEKFTREGHLQIQTWPFCSFTKSWDAVHRLARERGSSDAYTVVTSMTFPAEDVVIDINAFNEYITKLEQKDRETYDFDNADLYHYAHECEVIVRSPGHLDLSAQNAQVLEFASDAPNPPKVGDYAYYPQEHREDGYRIDAIEGEAGNGYWDVVISGADEQIYWDDGEWMIV